MAALAFGCSNFKTTGWTRLGCYFPYKHTDEDLERKKARGEMRHLKKKLKKANKNKPKQQSI